MIADTQMAQLFRTSVMNTITFAVLVLILNLLITLPLAVVLESVGERATALADVGPARLIRCKDAAVAAMLAADPVTAPHCSRAGERLICVPEQKLSAFRKGIARLGLVLSETPRG